MWDALQFTWNCPCRQSMTLKISVRILYFWNRPWVNIYWFLCQYLTSGVIWGLYVRLRDIPGATRPFLVDITSSRVVFSANLVPGVPCDNSKMCVRAWSLVMRLLSQTGFWRQMPLVTLANGIIWCLRRISSPRVSELVKNWSLWTEKCPRPWWRHFLLCDLGFTDFLLNQYMVMYVCMLSKFRQTVCRSNLSVKYTYLDHDTIWSPNFEDFRGFELILM